MDLKTLLVVVVAVGVVQGEDDHGYLVQLKLSLREEKIPAILTYLLDNSLEAHDITTRDIIQLSKLDTYDQNQLQQVFNFYDITEVYTVDNLEILLTSLNIKFGYFYRELTTKLELTRSQVSEVVNSLSIPPEFWVAVSLDDYDDIYNILRQGNYSEESVNAALQVSDKSITQVYTTARDIVREFTEKLPSPDFMKILTQNGWSKKSALTLYQALNITTPDVYAVEKFRNIFTNISDSLNQNISVGVFVGPQQLALHKFVFNHLQRLVDGVNIKVEANGVEITLKQTDSLGENIVEVATTQAGPDYIEIVSSYNTTENCTYVTLLDDQVSATSVEVTDLTIEQDGAQFILGTPLVCGGLLYGLAREENDSAIIFDDFYTEQNPPENDDFLDQESHNNKGILHMPLITVLTFNLISFLLL
ncbi:hypothetical protein Zmor_025365 [Zophobas morio]|uniref:Uncharacterized protein n=1 Tax=Zophobas morio TaxID=2755281 RepID=A0AA38HS04_9CUCU|nr:hypothetical protein Zmor_025365 [Zophobas morio]